MFPLLKIGNAFLDRACSCFHSQLAQIVCHLVKLCRMMLVMLQHIRQKSNCFILTVTALAGAAMSLFMAAGTLMAVLVTFAVLMTVRVAVRHAVFMGMRMAVLMSMMNQVAVFVFD